VTTFLAHLAGIALGETASCAARLALPPRFARPRTGDTPAEDYPIAEAPGASIDSPRPPSARDADAPAEARVADPIRSAETPPIGKPSTALSAPAGPRPSGAEGTGRPLRGRRAGLDSPIVARGDAAAARPADIPARSASPLARPRPEAASDRSLAAPAALPSGESRAIAAAPGPSFPVRLPREAPAHRWDERRGAPADQWDERLGAPADQWDGPMAPLSDAALTGRSERGRQAEPVIHVTIDRLEVRAASPPPPPPAPARRPAQEPSVSLSAFLRGEGSGARQ
jgi:hypothetical protein